MFSLHSKENFGQRLKEAFGHARNNEIAEQLGVSKATITLYTSGHLPPSESLLRIAEKTGCNIHWLMTGRGAKWMFQADQQESPKGNVIALYNDVSGGTGKSTSAVFLAMSFARRGYRTLLVDSPYDSSCSILMFPQLYEGEVLLSKSKKGRRFIKHRADLIFRTPVSGLDMFLSRSEDRSLLLDQGVKGFPVAPSELPLKYSYIVIDTGPRQSFLAPDDFMKARLLMSAKLLIPSGPLRLPEAIRSCVKSLEPLREQSDEIELMGAFVITTSVVTPRRFSEQGLKEARRLLPGQILDTAIHQAREVIDKVILNKSGAHTLGSKVRIVREYDRLAEEVTRHLEVLGTSGKSTESAKTR